MARRSRLIPLAAASAIVRSSSRSAASVISTALLPSWQSYGNSTSRLSGVNGNETVNGVE